jgi:protein-tyrosine-phosphatase
MAEGILRSLLSPSVADRVRVRSAGTGATGGQPATALAVETAEAKGIDIRDHRSTKLTAELLRESDLVLTMEPGQADYARSLAPEAAERVYGIAERSAEGTPRGAGTWAGIPDPIGGTAVDYDDTFNRIRSHLLRWLSSIQEAVERREGVR